MKNKNAGAVAAALLVGASFLAAPAANAATNSTVVAQDSAGMVIAQDQTAMLQATPSAPRAVTVTTDPGTLVTIDAKGVKPKTAVTNKDGQATFTKLKAGKQYMVTTNDDETTVVPVLKVGRATDLTIMTTDQVGTIDATWAHKATKKRGGADIGYTLTATPFTMEQGNAVPDNANAVSVEASGKQAELTGLDPQALYSFSVTPHNALGDGKPSVARMTRSLADITGVTGSTQPAAQDTSAKPAAAQPAPALAPAPAPAPAPKPAPAPAPKPGTKTIYVCPDGWDDVNGVCTQTKDYTFHTEQETQAYTYTTHSKVEKCTGEGCPGSEYVNSDTNWDGTCSQGTLHDGRCHWWTDGQKTVQYEVKDAPPMGWYDDGTQYAHDIEVKDSTPSGWSDNGSQWIRTTAKIEKVVPA